jgi:hypothetical protein
MGWCNESGWSGPRKRSTGRVKRVERRVRVVAAACSPMSDMPSELRGVNVNTIELCFREPRIISESLDLT